jgi:hypothetical protein
MPRALTSEHKKNHVEVCTWVLEWYQKEGEKVLKHIATGDERWVHHFEPESIQQSINWKHPSSPTTKFKAQVMLTLLWDSEGPILGTLPEESWKSE